MCFTKKGWISGISAGILLNVFSFIFSYLVPGKNAWYAEQFPEMMGLLGMIVMIISYFIPGLIMGLGYEMINGSLPWKGTKKGVIFGVGVWLLAGTMWPIMMISYAPMMLWVSEFITGFVSYAIVGLVIYHLNKK